MGPKKRGATKRKTEEALEIDRDRESPDEKEAEEKEERKSRNKKYIGAHVGIQGEA